MALTGSLVLGASLKQTSTLDISEGTAPLSFLVNYQWNSGTGRNQATTYTSDNRVLAGDDTDSFDLAGGLVDSFGNTVTFTRVRAIMIEVGANGPLSVFVTTGGNAFIGPMRSGDRIRVPASCFWVGVAPHTDGWPVVAGTGDMFRILNLSASNTDYNIIIIGTT